MFSPRTFLVIALTFLSANATEFNDDTETLQLVHIIFRHGDRTPTDFYPTSPYINETYYPIGIGELTNNGKVRMYEVGKSFRRRYDDYLGKFYTPGLIEARSTDVSRAKASLLLVLAGLFPPVSIQEWDSSLGWQPIPITYEKIPDDKELVGILCPKLDQLHNEYVNSSEYRKYFSEYQELADYLSVNSGWPITDMYGIAVLYFSLVVEAELNEESPEWTKSVFPSPITELAPLAYLDFSATPEFVKYVNGFLLQKVINDAYAKIDDPNSNKLPKMHLLSAHESNCAFMLITLEVFELHIPPYGSHVIMELHKIDGVYGYKIYYENFTGNGPQLLNLPSCGTFCPIDKFVSLYEKYLPDENTIC